MAATSNPPMLRTREVAARLDLAPKTIRDKARRGLIPAVRLGGGHWRFPADRLDAFLARGGSLDDSARAVDLAAETATSTSGEARAATTYDAEEA